MDKVGPILTSRLPELRAEVVYCQWQCTLLQTLTMTQPPGSHHPLHGSHLAANKAPDRRSCVGTGRSPLYRGELLTHAGATDIINIFISVVCLLFCLCLLLVLFLFLFLEFTF